MWQKRLEDLQLDPALEALARQVECDHPSVIWLSGRRSILAQAQAMAEDVVKDPSFIPRTYLHAATLQTALDQAPHARTVAEKQRVLYQAMLDLSEEELAQISDHLVGRALDLEPMIDADGEPTPEGALVLARINAFPLTKKLLTRESGLIRWHWAIHAPPRPVEV